MRKFGRVFFKRALKGICFLISNQYAYFYLFIIMERWKKIVGKISNANIHYSQDYRHLRMTDFDCIKTLRMFCSLSPTIYRKGKCAPWKVKMKVALCVCSW